MKKNGALNLTIHKRIIFVFILSAVCAILMVGIVLRYVVEKTTLDNWKKRQEFVMLGYAPQCNFEIEEAKKQLEFLSKMPEFSKLPYVDLIDRSISGIPENADLAKRDILQELLTLNERYTSIFILRPNGDIYLGHPYGNQLKSKRLNFADRPYFKEAIQTKRPVISDSFIGASQIPVVVVAVPVVDKADLVKAYIGGVFYLTNLSRLVTKERISNFDAGFIVDRKGHIIAHTDTRLVKEEFRKRYVKHALVSRFLDKDQTDESKMMIEDCVDPVDGKTYLTSFMPLQSGWGLGLAIRKDTVLSEIRPVVWRIIFLVSITIFVVSTIGVLFTLLIGKRWVATQHVLRKRTYDLTERVKELNCLYGISKLIENPELSIEEIIQGTVDLIPPAWQHPEITCSRIILGDKEYKTRNFEKTNWKQACDITMHGGRVGSFEVYYLEEKPEIDEGPFLKEERTLINAIAERLGHIVERFNTKAALMKSEEKYRDLYDSAPEMFVSVDAKTATILDCNKTLCNALDYKKDEIINRPIFDMYTPDSAEYAKKKVFPVFVKTGFIQAEELQLQRKDGSKIDVSLNVSAVRDGTGNILYSRSSWRDITIVKNLGSSPN